MSKMKGKWRKKNRSQPMKIINKIYTIDGKPASARDLIEKAELLDADYGKNTVCAISEAAQILRKAGYEVGYLKDVHRVEDDYGREVRNED